MIELLRSRRSIRAYRAEAVSSETVERLREALLRAPSSRGFNPWRFVFVDDPELLAKLSRAKPHGSSFVAGAPLAVVVCGDEKTTDVWIEDCSIAAFTLHLAAHAEGLGSCWVQIRNRPHAETLSAEDYVRSLLGLPEWLRVECIVALGHPAEAKPGHRADSLQVDKISWNGSSWT